MYQNFSKAEKEKLKKKLYKELQLLPMTWIEVSNLLGYAYPSALTEWHKKKEVPLSRVMQVYLFLEQYKKEQLKK